MRIYAHGQCMINIMHRVRVVTSSATTLGDLGALLQREDHEFKKEPQTLW